MTQACAAASLTRYIIASCLIASTFTAFPVLLIGLLIGIRCQKNKTLKASSPEKNEVHVATESRRLESTPVYEEVNEGKNNIELKSNIAYETVKM